MITFSGCPGDSESSERAELGHLRLAAGLPGRSSTGSGARRWCPTGGLRPAFARGARRQGGRGAAPWLRRLQRRDFPAPAKRRRGERRGKPGPLEPLLAADRPASPARRSSAKPFSTSTPKTRASTRTARRHATGCWTRGSTPPPADAPWAYRVVGPRPRAGLLGGARRQAAREAGYGRPALHRARRPFCRPRTRVCGGVRNTRGRTLQGATRRTVRRCE